MNALKTMVLLAFATLGVAANAQKFVKHGAESFSLKSSRGYAALAPKGDASAAKAPAKALADNQRYIGLDLDDEVPSAYYGLGLPGYTVQSAGSAYDVSLLGKYQGCKVVGMRYGLAYSATVTRVFVEALTKSGYIGDTLAVKNIEGKSAAGWTEVKFDEPFVIDTAKVGGYLLGFDYKQLNTENYDSYPLAVSGTGEDSGFMLYGNLNSQYGWGWYNMGTSYGNLCVQLIVEKEGGFDPYDIVMKDVYRFPFAKAGEEKELYLTVKNDGAATITKSVFGVSIDGKEVATVDDGTKVGGAYVYLTLPLTLPTDLAAGDHSLSVYAKSVQDATPMGYLDNDTLTTMFKVYTESFGHQKQLVEHFTSQYCTWCPYGYNTLNALCDSRSDVEWVSIHGDMSSGKDVYTLSDAAYITAYACPGFPSANFNRFYLFGEEALGQTISYQDATKGANYLSQVIDMANAYIPAFATVDISTDYESATRSLSIGVTGKLTADWKETLGEDAVLTVYLTEDSLVSKQLYGQTWIQQYPHDHVLRKIVTDPLGTPLGALDDNTYDNTFSVTLGKQWKPENMHVVAFVSRPIVYISSAKAFTTDVDDAWVSNANSVKLYSDPTAVKAIKDNASATVAARYNANGVRLNGATKGLNIVKLSDGTVKKVMVE